MDEIELINTKLDALFDAVMDQRSWMKSGFNVLGESQDALWERYFMIDDKWYNENQIRQLMNEVTYLHNRVNELEKVTGLDGSVPKKRIRSSYD